METYESILPYLNQYSYVGLYGMILACSLGFPFSKTLAILAAGVLASQGIGNLVLFMVVGIAGLVTADGAYYLLGYAGGDRILQWRVFARRRFREKLLEAEGAYQRHAWWAVFSARFTPFLRTVIFLSAGISRMTPRRFLSADILSALLYVPVVSVLGFLFSEKHKDLGTFVREGETIVAVLVLAILFLAFILAMLRRRRS